MEDEGLPCGTKTFLGFPRPTGCSVGNLAHAGYVGFSGCEIASARNMLANHSDSDL